MLNKKTKKILLSLAVVCVAVTLCVTAFTVFNKPVANATDFVDVKGSHRYIFTNPYKNVNWDTWHPYKGATHVHTNISDGDIDFADMIENYYALGYDCLAITDHGTVNKGWTASKSRHTIFGYQAFVHGSTEPLSSGRNAAITTGSDRNGQKMIDVSYGIELNGASTNKVHVNSWFASCGDGDMEMNASGISGAITAIKKAQNAGAISRINHVGEWSGGNDGIGTYDASFVSSFAGIYNSYSCCVGMELVNTADSRTKNDRYLYDQTLKLLAPNGRKLWGYCEDDSHDTGDLDRNAQIFWMPENTMANVRTCMETGAFFASSKNSGGYYNELGLTGTGVYPAISRLTADDNLSQLIFNVTNATKAVIMANGNVLAEKTCNAAGDTVVFDLNEYESSIGSYVRVYFTGPGGITYVQPFYLTTAPYNEATATITSSVLGATIRAYDGAGNELAKTFQSADQATYSFDSEGSFTYSVEADGYFKTESSFSITTADLSESNDVQVTATLAAIPVIEFENNIPCHPNTTAKIIDGFTDFSAQLEAIAHSSSTEGEIVITPTPNGNGTGTKISLIARGEIVDTYTVVIYGDLDGNAVIDATDANVIDSGVCSMPLSPAALAACDVNNDGVLTQADCELLVRAGLTLENLSIVQAR